MYIVIWWSDGAKESKAMSWEDAVAFAVALPVSADAHLWFVNR